MTGFIRIIAGKFKGKKIKVAEAMDLRPTPNRLRESIFNVLQFSIRDAICLDAFSGTGALGLEAASRGAKEVIFLENDLRIYRQLLQTIQSINHPQLHAIQTDCLQYLQTTSKTFDIIFLDPPFRQNFWEQCVQIITDRGLLSSEGILYIESPHLIEVSEQIWGKIKCGKIGDVYFGIYKQTC